MWLFIPAVLSVWGLVVTGVYMLRAVKNIFYGDMPDRWAKLEDAKTPIQKAPFLVLIGTLLFFGFYPQPMIDVIHQGAEPVLKRVLEAGEAEQAALPVPADAGETADLPSSERGR